MPVREKRLSPYWISRNRNTMKFILNYASLLLLSVKIPSWPLSLSKPSVLIEFYIGLADPNLKLSSNWYQQ
jgi:hypothetical protein